MRKFFLLFIILISGLGFLFFLKVRSQNTMASNHQKVLELFLKAKHIEATLEKDLLKSRNYLLLSYDPIVLNEADASQICLNLRSGEYALYQVIDSKLDLSIDDYCSAIETKVNGIERFKSKNAIFRNSIYVLQRSATESILLENKILKKTESFFYNKLITSVLAYALISTTESKSSLVRAIDNAKSFAEKQTETGNLETMILHAMKILETKEALDLLTKNIGDTKSSHLLGLIRKTYFHHYAQSEASAMAYRQVLFGACTLFLILIIFGITRLWKAARRLTYANLTLETRVEERTRELKNSQEIILQQQQILVTTSKMSALGEMAGGVAHEINTPLAIISLRVEQLEESVMEGEIEPIYFMENLDVIKQTTDRIAKIVNGLRFFSRDGRDGKMQIVSVKSLVDETLSFCKERFKNHGVQLEIIDPKSFESLNVECRSVEISQVLLNLLNNSYDAIQSFEQKWIRVEITEYGEEIDMSVTDCGLGIPEELHERLMDPFFTTKEVGKGTGLGLSISRGIVASHQGKLILDTDSPNTKFIVRLPKRTVIKDHSEAA